MSNHTIGCIATSMAGHDVEKSYIIIKEEKGFLFLADGEYKTMEKPKKKAKKHLQINCTYDTGELPEKLLNNKTVYDHEIKRTLKLYHKHIHKSED